jgi:hypothetical protein
MKYLFTDVSSDPFIGFIFVAVFFVIFFLIGFFGDEKDLEKFSDSVGNLSESTGNKSKRNQRRKLRRYLEKELGLPHETLSTCSIEQLKDIKRKYNL